MTEAEQLLRRAAEMLEELDLEAGSGFPARVYGALAKVAQRRLDGVRSASVTTWDGRRFSTAAATDEAARKADRLQHDRGADASGEIAELGLGGLLALPLTTSGPAGNAGENAGDNGATDPAKNSAKNPVTNSATLNLYSERPHGLDERTIQLATLLAIHARTSLAAADGEARAVQLERSRETTQRIGAAVGVLMVRNGLGHDEAMDLLRTTSQRSNTRVSDLAATVIDTGDLPPLKNRAPRPKRA